MAITKTPKGPTEYPPGPWKVAAGDGGHAIRDANDQPLGLLVPTAPMYENEPFLLLIEAAPITFKALERIIGQLRAEVPEKDWSPELAERVSEGIVAIKAARRKMDPSVREPQLDA